MSGQRQSRTDKTAATRARVLESAHRLFMTQGYAATTTRQIAGDAAVSERTLFNIAASKSDLLRQVLLTYVFDADVGPLLERRDFAATVRATSPEEFLTQFARWVTRLHRHTSATAEMVRAAAPVDPGAAEIWSWGNGQQVVDCGNLAGYLRARGWLRDDLSLAETSQSLAVLSGHETYWRLVVEQRWTERRYRSWLRRHCAVELGRAA
jgi:AcrR family transcriptional regulator